jgi:hypothetical protein
MSPEEAVERLIAILAHAWMVRTFLKHADEIQHDPDLLDVPRTLYDSIRAVEPAFQRKDWGEYLRRLKGKLPKIRRAAEYFAANFRAFSPHTNYEMASLSLLGVVRELEEVFANVTIPPPAGGEKPRRATDPLDDLEIPEV